jgi:hypothetical protein
MITQMQSMKHEIKILAEEPAGHFPSLADAVADAVKAQTPGAKDRASGRTHAPSDDVFFMYSVVGVMISGSEKKWRYRVRFTGSFASDKLWADGRSIISPLGYLRKELKAAKNREGICACIGYRIDHDLNISTRPAEPKSKKVIRKGKIKA